MAIRSEGGQEKRLTYKAIDRLSDILALRLAGLGVGRGDVISFQFRIVENFPCCISPA